MSHPVYVFYDSKCAVCHFVVRFLLKRRARKAFRFLPLHLLNGKFEEVLSRSWNLKSLDESVVVIKDGFPLFRSNAVLGVLSELGGLWTLFQAFKIIPSQLLDLFYSWFASIRYKVMGKARSEEVCELPSLEIRLLLLNALPHDFILKEKNET